MNEIRETRIYYFTGTGNSKKVADWLCSEAKQRNIDCSLNNILQTPDLKASPAPDDTQLIFISPIHGFNYPPVMLKFIAGFPRGKNRVVLMNTRAGMKIGKWITPGVTGIAFYLSALLLLIKGYKIQALKAVDLPSNWVSLHPGLNDPTVLYLHQKNKERISRFSGYIFSGKRFYRCLLEVYDLFLLPVAAGYYLFGRFFLSKTFVASRNCNLCGKCVEQCPVQAIKWIEGRPYWTLSCESCMHCMSYCPQKAIETCHGSVLVFALIWNVLFLWMTGLLPAMETCITTFPVIAFLIKWLVIILLLAFWYRIVHFLMRFRWVERMVVFTSLTHFKFWGKRYRALKNF